MPGPDVGSDGFDIIAELASMMPMRVIGMLLGIPESEQVSVRDANDANLRTKPGTPLKVANATPSPTGGSTPTTSNGDPRTRPTT